MNIAEWLERTAKATPKAPALLQGMRLEADYREFARRAAAIAAGLRDTHNIEPGARVGILMKNRTAFLEVLYGVLWAGAVAVPINAKLHPKEAAWILQNAQTKFVFVSDDVGMPLREADTGLPGSVNVFSVESNAYQDLLSGAAMPQPTSRADNDLAWLFYTSGTTGKPKGVMLTNGNLIAMSLCYPVDVDPVAPGDAALYAAPLSHGAGMYNFIHVRVGARHVVPESGGFDCNEILEMAPNLGDVSMFAAPTMVRRLVEAAAQRGLNGAGLKTIVYGGAPMYVADIEQAVAIMGPRFVQIYGLGESPMTITSLSRSIIADRAHNRWRQRLGSAGMAQSCMQVRVVDEDGDDLPIGQSGEVLAKGAAVMAGYWRNEAASAMSLRDGWLWTGDIGSLDEDGFLTLSDRSNDVVISGGTNIYPREVEEVLLTLEDVREVAVVGRPHPDWGEEIVAFVVLGEGGVLAPSALDQHCLNNIARFKRPKAYFQLDELPKNNYGKVLKTALREMLKGAD